MAHTESLAESLPDGGRVCAVCGRPCGSGEGLGSGIRFHSEEVAVSMGKTYTVTERIIQNGYLVATPGDEVDEETAKKLGIYKEPEPEPEPAKAEQPVDKRETLSSKLGVKGDRNNSGVETR